MSELTDEKREQMYLEEYALRFFALKNNRDAYVKEIGDFLTDYMEAVSDPKRGTAFDYEMERSVFVRTFGLLKEALGAGAFSGFNENGNPMGYFSALHFEAFALGLQRHLDSLSSADTPTRTRFVDALKAIKLDADFKKLTTGGGKNYAAALKQRVAFVDTKVGECLP